MRLAIVSNIGNLTALEAVIRDLQKVGPDLEQFADLEARVPKLRAQLSVLFHALAPATRGRIGKVHLDWLRELSTE